MIQKYYLGEISNNITTQEIENFLSKIPFYKEKIKIFKNVYYKNNWELEILKVINNYEK